MDLSRTGKGAVILGVIVFSIGMGLLHYWTYEDNPIVFNSSDVCVSAPLPTL